MLQRIGLVSVIVLAGALASATGAFGAGPRAEASTIAPAPCAVGAYRGSSGRTLALTATEGGFEYSHIDGRVGLTAHPKTRVRCVADGLQVTQPDNSTERYARLPLRLVRTRFASEGAELEGLLIEPGDADAATPLVVALQGSGDEPYSSGRWPVPWILAAEGVSVFVFDKRGTGRSTGKFTMNLHLLAADSAAAVREARRLAGALAGCVGFYGISQSGWVAPLAATRTPVDFIVVGYGMAYDALEEDAEEVAIGLRAKGHGEAVISKGRELSAAAARLVESRYREGFAELAALKAAYSSEPWYKDVVGEFTGEILKLDEAALRERGQSPDQSGLTWRHDAMGVLRRVKAPQLWVLGAEDIVTPPGETLNRLVRLQREGRPIDVAQFPGADHKMFLFQVQPDGSRAHYRVADGFYGMLADWVKGRRAGPYGNSDWMPGGAIEHLRERCPPRS